MAKYKVQTKVKQEVGKTVNESLYYSIIYYITLL